MSRDSRSRTRTTLLRRLVATTADKNAWSEFVEHYGSRIFRWCRGSGLQEADAEDLTQDLLLKLTIHMKTFAYDPTKSFHAWLKTITNYALIDSFKKNRRAQELLDNLASHKRLIQELQSEFDRELLEEAMVRVELRVEQATWEAFRFVGIEGLSAREAAIQLGVPESHIRVHKGRVAKMIREEIRKLEGQDAE
jgi:RNA polymerase sigma factor (sigma-70 family)